MAYSHVDTHIDTDTDSKSESHSHVNDVAAMSMSMSISISSQTRGSLDESEYMLITEFTIDKAFNGGYTDFS
jgi:hypothetical protein